MLATLIRGGAGTYATHLGPRPERRPILFEMESCPFSRKAREALSMLDLDVDVRPCPEGADHHRRMVKQLIGEEKVPVLVDPNRDEVVDESDDIVDYLFEHYGSGRVPWQLHLGRVTQKSSELASRLRADRGSTAKPARMPELPLELWSYEGSPTSRPVRETLSAYALPYVLHNVPPNGPSRRDLGDVRVPSLHDPNAHLDLSGELEIRRYLRGTYGLDG